MKKQILIVEDERIVADDIKTSLLRLGYEVCGIAISGEEAIKKAEEHRPDLVLMDIVLKEEMDGIETASIIRTRFDIPVVYLTAHADAKTLERAKTTEPFGYILKPFEDRDVHSTIEIAIYKHEMVTLLRESEERYSSVVENAHDAIYIMTREGLQYVNPAFEKLTGLKGNELFNHEFSLWKIIHPDDLESVKEKALKGSRRDEFRIISKNGEVNVVEGNRVIIGKNEEEKEIGILRDITARKRVEEELNRSLVRLQKTFEDTVNALVSALERRDPYTAGHQRRVANLACSLAQEMGLSKRKVEGIRLAGIVHDIGKIQIPTEILIKPTHLSEIEFVMIKTHPQVGFDILKEIEFPYPVAQIILQHHERMDGSGYPAGLRGNEIFLEARILAVADVVEAMSSHRPYRPALGIATALDEIKKYSGIIYDSKSVDACVNLFLNKKFRFD